jgi:hypothetical protein
MKNEARDADEAKSREEDARPAIEFYDPFARAFASKRPEDPLLRLYGGGRIVNDEF